MTEVGVAAISAQLLSAVTRHHAAIGADVSTAQLQSLENSLLEEGRVACYKQQWDEALNVFAHALAVVEKSKTEMSSDAGNRGTLVHNIAFCLHCMGEFEAAKAYYEQSLDCFRGIHVPTYRKVLNGVLYPERLAYEAFYGGLNHNRIQMTKERLLDISFGRKPDLTQLDQWGRKKPLPVKPADSSEDHHHLGYGDQARQYLTAWWGAGGDPAALWARSGSHTSSAYAAAAMTEEHADADAARGGEAPPRRPGWLAAAAEENEGAAAAGGSGPTAAPPPANDADESAEDEESRSPAEQEAARKEWLSYHLQVGEWEQAAELVVTREEHEDLAYLRDRAEREAEHLRRREQLRDAR